jgi:hypothetical protein
MITAGDDGGIMITDPDAGERRPNHASIAAMAPEHCSRAIARH